ncbi:MAG TPA: hypothetical protein VEP90_13620, partial [Methylomirabilota bacterium]|nr:hypothetical protein [Methylomirabilota bacterium]
MNDKQSFIPLDQVQEQDTVLFYDFPVTAVRLIDGRIGASLRDMCQATGLRRQPQVRRIQDDTTIASNL